MKVWNLVVTSFMGQEGRFLKELAGLVTREMKERYPFIKVK